MLPTLKQTKRYNQNIHHEIRSSCACEQRTVDQEDVANAKASNPCQPETREVKV